VVVYLVMLEREESEERSLNRTIGLFKVEYAIF
jgi:hypothetical protein